MAELTDDLGGTPGLASEPLTRTREEWNVAMIVVLLPVADVEPALEPARLEVLGMLGVTSVALLRDSAVAGVVLEGWAFDPRDVQRAVRTVAGASEGVRTLRPLAQMGISPAVPGGRKE